MTSIKVLYVDDETGMHDLVRSFLERSGEMQVIAVPSVMEAELNLQKDRYDAVISDYQMPDMDGLEFLKRLRSRNDDIPFILFTGRGREEVVIEALNSGADFYMQKGGKPLTQFAELEHYVVQGVQRYRAEKAKKESEEHFRSLVENSFEGIGVHIDGSLVEANNAFSEITGYSRDELIGMGIEDLFTPETWSVMSKKLKLPASSPYDVQVVRKDGRIVPSQTRGKNIVWNGQIARLGTILDITERKKMEEKLRESENSFRSLIETSPDMIWEIDSDGSFTYISPRISDILGYSQDQMIGSSIFSLTTPASTKTAKEHFFAHLHRPDQFSTFEVVVNHRNGTLRSIEVCSTPLYDSRGNVMGFRGNAKDVTERRRAEQAEKGAHALMSAILESSPDVVVFALDRGYRYLAYNKLHRETMRAIWGQEISPGMNMLDIVGQDGDRSKARQNFDQALSGQSFTVTEEYGDEDLKRLTWLDYYSPIVSESGEITGLTCYCLNVTEKELAKDALQDANNKLRIISSITRHDVLNKLTALHGYLELERRKVTDAKTMDHFEKMVQITRDLENQINFTKEYQDIGLLQPSWQDLNDVCGRARERVDHFQAEMVTELDGLEIYADPMLKKVFHNLMDNSMRHGQRVTTIRIGYRSSDGSIRIVYQDDGVGIAEEQKSRLFREGTSKNHGLGLFLAKEILKITDITIQETGQPGEGARFEMKVPLGKFRFRE